LIPPATWVTVAGAVSGLVTPLIVSSPSTVADHRPTPSSRTSRTRVTSNSIVGWFSTSRHHSSCMASVIPALPRNTSFAVTATLPVERAGSVGSNAMEPETPPA
jgi:hypothetical protein